MKLKKILLIILLIIILAGVIYIFAYTGNKNKTNNNKLNVVVTTFSTYDFVRQVAGDNVNLTFLLGPGVEAHSYEPTASDLAKIQNADLFIYVGGEMEEWTGKVLDSLNTKNTKLVCIADYIEKMEEEEIDSAEEESEEHESEEHVHDHEEGAYDEHIWTSPKNAIKMVEEIEKILAEKDSKNKETYETNANNYINQIKNVQAQIQQIVDNKVRSRLVFGDKMPMQYFIKEYNLEVSAAFAGCSTQTDPSASTIAKLVQRVKEEQIPVILYIELNNGKVAQTIAKETGAKPLQIQTLHNITKDDFTNGETYVSLMQRNLDVLKQALQ